jgi:drug/metabolite transporter (DMT)-like permease
LAALLALGAALGYGLGDFWAGLASRDLGAGPVAGASQSLGLAAALVAVVLFGGHPSATALGWGAVSGLGSALGTLSLYHGLAIGRMSVVATLSAVLTAIVPVVVGLAGGDHLGVRAGTGIVLAVPAIVLVSWTRAPAEQRSRPSGALYGALAGVGFAVLLVALDRARRHSGAWPLVPGQAVAVAGVAPFVLRARRHRPRTRPRPRATALAVGAGVLSGASNILFLASTRHGALAVVAVLTALYPVVTVVLARFVLGERWTRGQAGGLVLAAVAVALVSLR